MEKYEEDIQKQKPIMPHSEFVKSYNEGRIALDVNKRQAVYLINEYKFVNPVITRFHIFFFICTWTWGLSIPVAIVSFIFFKWWVGVLILLIGFSLPRIIKHTSTGALFKQALKDKDLYDLLTDTNTLVIKEKFGSHTNY